MFIFAHASYYEQCSWWKVKKRKTKRRSCPNQPEMDTFLVGIVQYQAKSPRSMGLKLQIHYSLSPAHCLRQIWITLSNFISQHSDVCVKDTTHEYCPENNKARIEKTHKFIKHS
jgi:hypothetical protein